MKKKYLIFLCWILLYSPALYAQQNIDKRIAYLRDIYKNLQTYSETGTYQTIGDNKHYKNKVSSSGKHSMYFDNVNKKIRIESEITYDTFERFIGKCTLVCASATDKANIWLLNGEMNEKQEEFFTRINRHNASFFLSNPTLSPLQRGMFEDTIPIRVEEEILNKTKCYKLIRKYDKPVDKRVIEMDKKERMVWDSLGRVEEYDMMTKRDTNTDPIEEIYWFRKSDGALLKKIHKITFFSDLLGVHVITTEYKFEPQLNPKLPKNIFD